MPGGLRRHRKRLALGFGVAACAGMAIGQQAGNDPAAVAFVDVRTGITYSDNPRFVANSDDESSLIWRNDLTFGYDTESRDQRLSFRLGGAVEFGDVPETVALRDGVVDPFFSLEFQRSNRSTALGFSVRLRERDVGFAEVEDLVSGRDLIVDQGRVRSGRVDVNLALGRDAPVGLTLDAFYSETNYQDTSSADLTDLRSRGISGEVRFSVSRTTDILAFARFNEREADNAADTLDRNRTYGLGLTTQLDPATSMRIDLGFGQSDRLTTDAAGNRNTDREQGPTLGFDLVRTVKTGSVSVSVDSRVTTAGTQTELRFGREITQRAGRFRGTVGVGFTSDGETRGVGSIDWTREGKDSAFSMRFSQALSADPDGDEDTVQTSLSATYAKDLTDLSRLSLSMGLGAVTGIADDADDRRSVTLTAAYTHQLTRDWALTTGYRHRRTEQTASDDIQENEVFATVGRRFSVRP